MFEKFLNLCLVLPFFFLAACATDFHIAGKPLPDLTFAHMRPVPVNVASIKTHDEINSRTESFVVSPYEAIKDYLHARFVPKGFAGSFVGKIEEATIMHSYEPSKNKFGKYLDVAGFDVYDMIITFRLEHLDKKDSVVYGTTLTARRIVKVSEHASIAEREKRQLEGMEKMFSDFDKEVRRIVLRDMRLGMAGGRIGP